MKKTIYIIIAVIILTTCSSRNEKNAKKTANEFIDSLQRQDYEKTISYFSEDYLYKCNINLPPEEIFRKQEQEYGRILSYKIKSFSSSETFSLCNIGRENTQEVVYYYITYRIERERGNSLMMLKFRQQAGSAEIRLIEEHTKSL